MGQDKDQGQSVADHWQFSLAVYTREGVAGHCLELQNRLGLDVNVLLVMLWAAGQWGEAPTTQQIEDADSTIVAWRHEVIVPLRQLRTRLKTGPAPAPDAATEMLREEVKRLELDAERLQQDVLAQWVKEQALARTRAGHGGVAQDIKAGSRVQNHALIETVATEDLPAVPGTQTALANTAENARKLAVLEQTAVRVVAHYEAAYAQTAADEGHWAGQAANEQAADPWLALQHAHQVVLAALAVLCQI